MTDRDLINICVLHTMKQVQKMLNRKDCQTARKLVTTEILKAEQELMK